ncbi:hypothetical protein K2173_016156 [Erythroxylum novogranatense]|uniref:Amine oxidase domain-containing protein n=1 Tax=Erythroxylum novogranatense TaxID=1862640 RepID=A0AAV8SGB0_9ROSI|nr:hypothetical protein K2173_016156 [Erythroxylum novogranatense]
MVAKKPKVVIIGAGMAGLTAANKLYTCTSSRDIFELCVVEGGTRIGGRINTSEFGGDRIEMGATWIHGIGGSPVHKIAQEIHSLQSEQPWECMDGFLEEPLTMAEGGLQPIPSIVDSLSTLFKKLMDYARGELIEGSEKIETLDFYGLAAKAYKMSMANGGARGKLSVGSFLRVGLDAYWDSLGGQKDVKSCGNWSRKLLEEAIFGIHETTQRVYTSAGDLSTLDFHAEREYIMCPDEEITIAKGYLSVIESLASVLPDGLIQLGRKVTKIEWQSGAQQPLENGHANKPVKLHFCDGSVMLADHVIVTVSLGVLKAEISKDSGMFSPPLPSFKTQAISRLGFGLVNKLFLQINSRGEEGQKFPFLQMAFRKPDSDLRDKKVPWWIRKTASLCPIYKNSSVLLSWFAGEEALELESLSDEEIINGVSATVSSFLPHFHNQVNYRTWKADSDGRTDKSEILFTKVLRSKWGTNPLFLGSYSYVAVGSSGEDMDSLAEPLPMIDNCETAGSPPLQVLFAGEATHRTHYSTTHGAYFSGLREATRLLQHYNCVGV